MPCLWAGIVADICDPQNHSWCVRIYPVGLYLRRLPGPAITGCNGVTGMPPQSNGRTANPSQCLVCRYCGAGFVSAYHQQKYCDNKCRREYERYYRQSRRPGAVAAYKIMEDLAVSGAAMVGSYNTRDIARLIAIGHIVGAQCARLETLLLQIRGGD